VAHLPVVVASRCRVGHRLRAATTGACHLHAGTAVVNLPDALASSAALAGKAAAGVAFVANVVALAVRAGAPASPGSNVAHLPVVVASRCRVGHRLRCWSGGHRLRRWWGRHRLRGCAGGDAEGALDEGVIGRIASAGASGHDLRVVRQDLVDATVDGLGEQALDDVHRCRTSAAIVVARHEDNVPCLLLGPDSVSPVASQGIAALAKWPVRVDEEDGCARGHVPQAHVGEPAVSPPIIGDPLVARLAELREGGGAPRDRARVRRGALVVVEAIQARAAYHGGNILALLEADQVEGALALDLAVERAPAVVLPHVPPV